MGLGASLRPSSFQVLFILAKQTKPQLLHNQGQSWSLQPIGTSCDFKLGLLIDTASVDSECMGNGCAGPDGEGYWKMEEGARGASAEMRHLESRGLQGQ